MAEPIRPEHWQELIAGYVLGDLSPAEAETVQQLLAAEPELVSEVRQLQEVLAAMPYSLPEVAPPAQLRSAIETAVSPTAVSVRPTRRRLNLQPLVASLAAVVLAAFAIDNVRLRQQLTRTQAQAAQQQDLIAMLQEAKTQVVSLKGMDRLSNAAGNVVITPGLPQGILILQKLPALPPGQSYQLWSVVDGKKVASGQFAGNPKGNVFVKVPLSASAGLTGLVVTVEASATPDRPTGPMVMTSTL
jgi:anti-sigma-K factor RskA